MGKSSSSQPSAPDPVATAGAQAAANKETAITQAQLNQVNQRTPYGSLEWNQRGTSPQGTPQYEAVQTLAPAQQQMLDLTNQAGIKYGQTANTQLNSVSDRLASPLDFGSLGPAPQVNEATRQATAQSMYDRMNPQFDRDRAALETRLANQGIALGSQAYSTGMDELRRGQNDARLAVDSQAGNEMARMYQLESAARNQGINEMLQQRSVPLNELAAMLTGSQVQAPQFINPPQAQVATTDVAGPMYANYNAQLQQQQAANQGLYSLLGTGAMLGGMTYGGNGWSFGG